MQSKRSFFSKTIFRKNMTRFAPAWILYTLYLLVNLAVMYTEGYWPVSERCYWFTISVTGLPGDMAIVIMLYGLLVAMLLFGDLYNSRMCNALHALPLRRESWLITNVVSGLVFSLIPTVIAALVLYPMLATSIFTGVWKLPLLFLLSANLEFICFFGIAVFCAMCVGSRLTMAAGYGLLCFGAAIAYWIINTMYTPLLYGVITPSQWADALTPMMHATQPEFFEIETDLRSLMELAQQQQIPLSDTTASFRLTDQWWRMFMLAGVGLAFIAGAVLLYRKRNLECAGDAVAFPILTPVFQVLCTLFVGAGSQYMLRIMLGYQINSLLRYIILAAGLAVGWFTGRILLERSIRVFRRKNWYGLGILAGVMALSLVCTHFDVLGIETRLPDPEEVDFVVLGTSRTPVSSLKEPGDTEKVIRLHRLALENRPGNNDLYVRGYDGSFVAVVDTNDGLYDRTQERPEYAYAAQVPITYVMKDGSSIRRRYNIWVDREEGNLARQLLSRWEIVSGRYVTSDGTSVNPAELSADTIRYLTVDGKQARLEGDLQSEAWSFLDAVKADCAAGNMVQDSRFHRGLFRENTPSTNWSGETYYRESGYIPVEFGCEENGWYVQVYPESTNCIRWLQSRNLLDRTIDPDACADWYPLTEEATPLPAAPETEPAEATQPSATKPTDPEPTAETES